MSLLRIKLFLFWYGLKSCCFLCDEFDCDMYVWLYMDKIYVYVL